MEEGWGEADSAEAEGVVFFFGASISILDSVMVSCFYFGLVCCCFGG